MSSHELGRVLGVMDMVGKFTGACKAYSRDTTLLPVATPDLTDGRERGWRMEAPLPISHNTTLHALLLNFNSVLFISALTQQASPMRAKLLSPSSHRIHFALLMPAELCFQNTREAFRHPSPTCEWEDYLHEPNERDASCQLRHNTFLQSVISLGRTVN